MIKEGKSKAFIQYSGIEIQWYTFMIGQGNTLAYTPISKNVVGGNSESQLSNGNCTTERNCGFHIWYAKTMSSSRGA